MGVIIYNDKVYTSSFSEVEKHVMKKRQLSISKSSPGTFKGGHLDKLNPPWELINAYKGGGLTDKEYELIYKEKVLNKLDPTNIYEEAKGKVLCCWEKKGNFCHRQLVLKWLGSHLGSGIIGGEL